MPDNTITIVGNLTRDPELRFTANGIPRATLGIAVNHRFNNRNTNEWEDRPSFFNAVCWRDMAQNVSDSLSRGNRVVITGRLEQRTWETQEGEKRSVIEVIADEVAPSLRWATAQIERTTGSGQSYNQNAGASNPGAGNPGANNASGETGAAANNANTNTAATADAAAGSQVSQDEEPF